MPSTHLMTRHAQTVLVCWILITLGLAVLQGQGHTPLRELVVYGPMWPVLAAVLFLHAVTRYFRLHDPAWHAPPAGVALRLLAFPLLLVCAILALGQLTGFPPSSQVVWILINTALVALSEEWMFRGLLHGSLIRRFSPWETLWLSSAIFGLIHALNGLITGHFAAAGVQALAAVLTGTLMSALRQRSHSLWPPILVHMLWDASLLLVMPQNPVEPAQTGLVHALTPLLFVLPGFLYAMYLMHGVRRPSYLKSA